MIDLNKGDYVLATKYSDGSPKDQWVVGFYDGTTGHNPVRHEVTDEYGCLMRGNGFRRCEKIDMSVGEYLLDNVSSIERGNISLWDVVKDLGSAE